MWIPAKYEYDSKDLMVILAKSEMSQVEKWTNETQADANTRPAETKTDVGMQELNIMVVRTMKIFRETYWSITLISF